MKIINSNSIFDFVNHGFVYLCQVDDGSYWVRSVAGKWVEVKTSIPVGTEDLDKDLQKFLLAGIPATENDVKIDNSSQVIIDPIKSKKWVVTLLGENPSVVSIGEPYVDMGVSIIDEDGNKDSNPVILYFINSLPVDSIVIDTSKVADYVISYIVTDKNGIRTLCYRGVNVI